MVNIKAFFNRGSNLPNNPKPAPYVFVVNYGAMRSGQPIAEAELEAAINRNDMCNFIVRLMPKLAFQEGYDILEEEGGEKTDWSDEFSELFKPEVPAGIERGWGAVDVFIVKDEIKDESRFISFMPKNVTFDVNDTGDITDYEMEEFISQEKGSYTWKVPEETGQLDDVVHVVLRPAKFRYMGSSILEPLWDVSKGRTALLQSAALLTVRVASGIKTATFFDRGLTGNPSNEETRTMYEDNLKGYESGDYLTVLQSGVIEGVLVKDEVNIGHGDVGNFTFEDKMSLFHMAIALQLTVPKNAIDGIFQGETVGARAVLELLYGAYRIIQKDWIPFVNKIAERWCKHNNKTWNVKNTCEFRPLVIMSEKEQADISAVEMSTYAEALAAGIMDKEEVRRKLDLKPYDKIIEKPTTFDFKIGGEEESETNGEETTTPETETGEREEVTAAADG